MNPSDTAVVDDIMEDLMVGHNFEYAREQILELIIRARIEDTNKVLRYGWDNPDVSKQELRQILIDRLVSLTAQLKEDK